MIESNKYNAAKSCFWGVSRGLFVQCLVYPLDVVKIRQQCCPNSQWCGRVAFDLLRKEGAGAFYKGLSSQLLRTSIKQAWCWPAITQTPRIFQYNGFGALQSQALTGIFIATIDAVITTPLERNKILAASKGRQVLSLKDFCKEGWKGFSVHWLKLSVTWAAFLTAQKYFRNKSVTEENTLSYRELSKIGVQVAIIVSLISAPFDIANTLKQTQNLDLKNLLSKKKVSFLYRGWPIHAFSLVIHNIASVMIIDKLDR